MNEDLTACEQITELMNAAMTREVTPVEMFAKILRCIEQITKEMAELKARSYHLDARLGDTVRSNAIEALRRTDRDECEMDETPRKGIPPGYAYSKKQKAKMYVDRYGKPTPEDRIKAQEKECVICNQTLHFNDFYANRSSADKKDSRCKKCVKISKRVESRS